MNITGKSPFAIGPVNQTGVALIQARTTSTAKVPATPPSINQLLQPFYGQAQNSHQATQAVNTVNSTQAHQATQYVQPGAKLPAPVPSVFQVPPPSPLQIAALSVRVK